MTDTGEGISTIEACLDLYVDGTLMGWACDAAQPGMAVQIQLYLGTRLVSVHRADRFRPDLLEAGLGTGHHGFHIPVSPDLAEAARRTGQSLAGRTPQWPEVDLFSLDFTEELRLPAPARSALATLFGAPETSAVPDPHAEASSRPRPTPASPLMDEVPRAGAAASRGRPPLFRYAEHVRHHRQLEAVYDPGAIASDFDHVIRWYLDAYNTERAPRRAPLSREVIRWLNEPQTLGGSIFSATRAMLWYMPGSPYGLDALKDPALYRGLVYWWACERAPALNAEDCLVPRLHVDVLRQVPEARAGRPFPLSVYMEEAILKRPSLQAFGSAQSVSERVTAYAVLCAEALAEPGLLRFVPQVVLDRFFGGAEPLFDALAAAACAGGEAVRPLDATSYRARLAARGFDLDTLSFTSVDAAGHRSEHARLGVVADVAPVDVQLIGPLGRASGIGHATRMSRAALRETGLSLAFADWSLDNPQPAEAGETVAAGLTAARVNLVHLNADLLPLVEAYGPDLGSDAYTIGFFFWELDRPAACHRLALDLVDEVWVASEYNRACFAACTSKPVVNVGMALDVGAVPGRGEARPGVERLCGAGPGDFVFLTTYDSLSYAQRKNPLGVLRAFQDAFPGDGEVRLVIKTHNAAAISEGLGRRVWDEIRRCAAEDDRIVVMDETLPYRRVLALKAGSDCYVSLHRSEGLGFGLLEAMRLGVPVVCTAYSGNLDFCDETTAWLVEADLVGVESWEYAHVSPGHRWAEPRHASAVAALRAVRAEGDLRGRRVVEAARVVTERYGAAATARRYADRLSVILDTRPARIRAADPAPEPSPAATPEPSAADVPEPSAAEAPARRRFFDGVLARSRG